MEEEDKSWTLKTEKGEVAREMGWELVKFGDLGAMEDGSRYGRIRTGETQRILKRTSISQTRYLPA